MNKIVKEIVAAYLKDNGFGGLFDDAECGCEVSDLAPCTDGWWGCEAGYKIPCPNDGDCDCEGYEGAFHIVRDKPTAADLDGKEE